jgi:putative lipoprotein
VFLVFGLLLAIPHAAAAQWTPPDGFSSGRALRSPGAIGWPAGNGVAAARVSNGEQARAEHDPWFGPDKVRHFFVSAAIQSIGYGTLRALDVEHRSALAGAGVVTAAFGIGKELSDRRGGRSISVRDLVWDAAGAAAISLLLARTER